MNAIKPGETYTYNLKSPPPEKERPENLYLSAFCAIHTEQTVGDLDRYDGKTEDKDPRKGHVKLETDAYQASLTRDGRKVVKEFDGTGYISGITGCAHHEKVKVHVEETKDREIQEVRYPEQNNLYLRNEIDRKTNNVTFMYMEG